LPLTTKFCPIFCTNEIGNGRGPERSLASKFKVKIYGNEASDAGIVPVRRLLLRPKYRRFCKFLKLLGMVPE
jgi:hypothetical protein